MTSSSILLVFTKAKREGKRVINIEELNRKTLDELIAIEGLASEYTGKMKESFRPQLNEFSKTILNKRAYHPGFWKFILGIRTRNYSEIANHSSLSAKYEWEIYKQNRIRSVNINWNSFITSCGYVCDNLSSLDKLDKDVQKFLLFYDFAKTKTKVVKETKGKFIIYPPKP